MGSRVHSPSRSKSPPPVPFSSCSPCKVKPELVSLLVNLNFASQPVQETLPICAQMTLQPGLRGKAPRKQPGGGGSGQTHG